MSITQDFTKGLWKEIPPFRLVLGLCPTLAVTTAGENGVGMGLATTFVLVFSNLLISLLRKVIPNKVRIAAFIVVIASFVVIVELAMQAYFYPLYKVLGIFIPLIVVNCIILGRAEAISLTVLGSVRELIGNGTLFGAHVMWSSFEPYSIMLKPPGAFLCLGLILGIMNLVSARQKGH